MDFKEIGTATGWTDADQQLHIPQTALQSYNEFAWSLPTTASNMIATVSDNADFDINTSDFTANCWVYLNESGTAHPGANGSYIFHKGGGGAIGWHINIKTDLEVKFIVDDGVADGSANIATAKSGANGVKLGKWHMITATVDHSATIALYIDGQFIDSTAFPSANNDIDGGGGLEMLNWHANYANGTLNGTATEFSIFKGIELNAAHVRELYNDGKALDVTTHSQVAYLKGYWRNDGLNTTWKNIHNPGTHDATLANGTETILIPQGVDGSRDSQGFIMNKSRNTSSLNLASNEEGALNSQGPGMEVYSALDYTTDGQFDSSGDGLGDFTVEFWFKVNRVENNYSVLYQNTGRNGSGDYQGLDIYIHSNGSIGAVLYIDNGSNVATWANSDSSGSVNYDDGNWHHLVFVADRSANGTLIIDKIVKDIVDISGNSSIKCFVGSNRIGSSASEMQGNGRTSRDALDGQIDGLRIYKDLLTFDTDGSPADGETLTSGEVLRNYNATKGSHRN